MGTRGRKSANELATRAVVGVVERPSPPLDLQPEEADVWRSTVDAMPADWFTPETWPLLTQWCRHVVTARRVAQMIDQSSSRSEIDVAELRDLMAMQARETGALKALSASMRISQQASYSARGASGEKTRRGTIARPWEG